MKILIMRFSSIGDIVLTTPVIRCLKKQLNADIHFVTKQSFTTILTANPYLSRVWAFTDTTKDILSDLKNEHFDCVIDLHNNLRSRRLTWALGIPAYRFDKLNIQKWLKVNTKWNVLPDIHIVDRYLAAAAHLGIVNDHEGLDYFIPEKDIVALSDWRIAQPYVAFVIGAAHATKRLPAEKIIEICRFIHHPIVLLGGKEDTDVADKIIQVIDNQNVINLCGRINLNQSASVVQQARCVITHDTGLMHIAAAFQKNIISVWGNTIPAFGMTPYFARPVTEPEPIQSVAGSTLSHHHFIFEIKNLSCRPCSKIGFRQCPKGHFKCMQLHDVQAIADAANRCM